MSYQKIIIVGNLGRDPEMRYTGSGTPVTSFSVATNRRWTGSDGSQQEETAWFRVSAWRRQAEVAAQYLSKGRQVMVEGRLQVDPETGGPRIWTGNDGQARASFEITAQSIIFLQGRTESPGGGQGQGGEGPDYGMEDEEGIPF
jgi:single-strand DNA-binding protein